MKHKVKEFIKSATQFILNPRLLLCFCMAWLITNGWSYILFAVGTRYGINWLITLSGAYLAFLWLPLSPEKLATFALAILFMRFFFPNDQKTLGKLRELHQKIIKKNKNKGD